MAFRLVDRRFLALSLRRCAPLRWMLKLAVRLFAPTHYVGAVVALFDSGGRVLLVEHVFRTDHPWGLPGGWAHRGELPIDAVKREVEEELQLQMDVKELLFVGNIPSTRMANHPAHLGFAYYARLTAGQCVPSREVLSTRWADPERIEEDLAPFQRRAVLEGRNAFARDVPRLRA
jgi:ADP-ribose pyrophosphatase YjhB (NUDIX family)